MVSQQMLISVALPVAAMAIVVGSVANVQDNTLAPGLDTLEAATSFGYPEVTIGGSGVSEDQAENQLRGLAVFNMLSAQNCLYSTQVYNRQEELSSEDQQFFENVAASYEPLRLVEGTKQAEDGELNFAESRYKSASELPESTFTYYNRGDVLRDALELEGFNGVCLGGKEISITQSLRDHYEHLDTVLDGVDMVAYAMTPSEWQMGEGADNPALNRGALQGRFGRIEFSLKETVLIRQPRLMSMKLNQRLTDHDAGAAQSTDFVRGSRAAVFFPGGFIRGEEAANAWDGSQDATIQALEEVTSLSIQTAGVIGGVGTGAYIGATAGSFVGGPIGAGIGGLLGGIAGGFFGFVGSGTTIADELQLGSHPGLLIGYDMATQSGNGDWFEGRGMKYYKGAEDKNFNWREDLNAFRVRMINVPVVMSRSFIPDDARTWNNAHPQMGLNYIISQSNYVLCKDSQGFLQSNAGAQISYDGKEQYQNADPIPRDVVYPRIELTTWNPSCLENAVFGAGTIRDGNEYYKTGSSGRFRSHVEFLNEQGDFTGPISKVPGMLPADDISKMKSGNDFHTITPDDARIILDPDTTVGTLTQGLDRISAGDMGIQWWDNNNIFYPVYAVTGNQCEQYQGKYDITRMFTDNLQTNSLYETEGDEEPQSNHYEVIEEDGEYKVRMESDHYASQIPRAYYFDRFNYQKFRMNFTLNAPEVDSIESEKYQQGWSTNRESLSLFFDNPNTEGTEYIWVGFQRQDVAVGTNGYTFSEDTELIPSNAYMRNTDINLDVNRVDNVKDAGVWPQNQPPAPPMESKFELVLDKQNNRFKLYMWVSTESGKMRAPVLDANFDNAPVNLADMGRLKIRNRNAYATDRAVNVVTTVENVQVQGTIKGCPEP